MEQCGHENEHPEKQTKFKVKVFFKGKLQILKTQMKVYIFRKTHERKNGKVANNKNPDENLHFSENPLQRN